MEEFVKGRPKRRELVAVVGVGGNKAVNEEGSGMEHRRRFILHTWKYTDWVMLLM